MLSLSVGRPVEHIDEFRFHALPHILFQSPYVDFLGCPRVVDVLGPKSPSRLCDELTAKAARELPREGAAEVNRGPLEEPVELEGPTPPLGREEPIEEGAFGMVAFEGVKLHDEKIQ